MVFFFFSGFFWHSFFPLGLFGFNLKANPMADFFSPHSGAGVDVFFFPWFLRDLYRIIVYFHE